MTPVRGEALCDQPLPVHRSIMVVDVERFSDPARTDLNQVAIRDAMYKALKQAFGRSEIAWDSCVSEDRGDGALILIPPDVSKARLLTSLPGMLAAVVSRHNARCTRPERMRLRVALHAGEIYRDAYGVAGTAINQAFRLVEAPVLRSALDESPGMLALIISDRLFTEVARHHPAAEPGSYRQVQVIVKETATAGWIRVPDLDAAQANASEHDMVGTGDFATVTQDLFSGEFERLRDMCFDPAPLARDLDLARFTGREWLISQIDTFIQRRPRGYVIIQAEAGVGKSTLAAHLARTRPWLCHFTRLPGGRVAGGGAQEPGRAADRRVGPARVGTERSAARRRRRGRTGSVGCWTRRRANGTSTQPDKQAPRADRDGGRRAG